MTAGYDLSTDKTSTTQWRLVERRNVYWNRYEC